MKTGIQIVLALALGLAGASSSAFGARPKPQDDAADERITAQEEQGPAAGMTWREDAAEFAAFRNEARAWREQPVKPALPEEVNRRRVLAEDAIRNKEYEDAIVHYERGLGLVPLWPEGQFNIALLYAELGEYGLALVHMKRYLELVPDAADARAAREKMYVWEERAGKPRSPGSGMSAKLKKELAAHWREKPDPGRRFLIENAARDGVATLPSGLQYRIVSAGKGKTPSFEDTVLIHYRGTLIDGNEFDSTHRRGKPAELPVKLLLKGMAEALLKMPVGSRWTLFVPPDLAYGERVVETRSGDATVVIGPNATLIYELELLEIR